MVLQARIIKEKSPGVWRRVCDVQRQKPNTGLNWTEFSLNKLSGQAITETTENRNYQQLSGQLLQQEAQMAQIIVKVSDRTMRKIASVVKEKFGSLAGNAMERLQDEDYLATFSGLSTQHSPGTGTPLSHSAIAAAADDCQSNVTEPSNAEVFTVLHGYQKYDIQAELNAGVGTYTVQDGITAEVFRKGFAGTVGGSNLFTDGNITVDSTPDARGATHTRDGIIAIIGMELQTKKDYDMYFGGGAEVVSLTNEYAFLERTSAGTQVWAYAHLSDATRPTT